MSKREKRPKRCHFCHRLLGEHRYYWTFSKGRAIEKIAICEKCYEALSHGIFLLEAYAYKRKYGQQKEIPALEKLIKGVEL